MILRYAAVEVVPTHAAVKVLYYAYDDDQSVAAVGETHNQMPSVGGIKGALQLCNLGSPRRVHRCEYMQIALGRR